MAATLTKKEMEQNLRSVVDNTMKLLESLHVVHKDDPIEKILDYKLPIGENMTLASLLVNIYGILEPLLDLARKQFPALFVVIDWLEATIQALMAN